MKNWIGPVILILFAILVFSLMFIASNNTYGAIQLRSFNQLNKTDYTLQQWRIYEYEIRKLHPFNDQK
jgi:hypothetical protein